MSLSAGSRLGPSEILSPLGAGGMGDRRLFTSSRSAAGRSLRTESPSWRSLLPDGKSVIFGYVRVLSDLHVVDGLE